MLPFITLDSILTYIYLYTLFISCVVTVAFFSAQIAYSSAPRRTCGAVCCQMTMEEKPLSENQMLVSFLLLFVLFCLMGLSILGLTKMKEARGFFFWLFLCGGMVVLVGWFICLLGFAFFFFWIFCF